MSNNISSVVLDIFNIIILVVSYQRKAVLNNYNKNKNKFWALFINIGFDINLSDINLIKLKKN